MRVLILVFLITCSGVIQASPEWVLHGTLVLGEGRSMAILRQHNRLEQQAFREGSVIDGRFRITSVAEKYILIAGLAGEPEQRVYFGERLALQPPEQVRNLRVDQVLRLTQIVPALFQKTDLVSYQVEGKVAGFYVRKLAADSLLARLGLRQGDIVLTLNGTSLTEDLDAAALYRDVQQQGLARLGVRRKDSSITLAYRVPGMLSDGLAYAP